MPRAKAKTRTTLLERMQGKASWLISHAQALGDYGLHEEECAELARAAMCEEQVACLLERNGQERDAAIHRVSAASCYQQIGQFTRAVTLLRAALSAQLLPKHRADVEKLLQRCLAGAQKEVSKLVQRRSRKQAAAVS